MTITGVDYPSSHTNDLYSGSCNFPEISVCIGGEMSPSILMILLVGVPFNPVNFINFLLMQHFFQGTNVNSETFIRNIFLGS